MANRDYDDDRRWGRDQDRGQRDYWGQDDQESRQGSQSEDRSGGYDRSRDRGNWPQGRDQDAYGGRGVPRGGMSQSGGAYGRPDDARGYGRDYGQDARGQGYGGRDDDRGYGDRGYGAGQSRADMGRGGFDRDRAFGYGQGSFGVGGAGQGYDRGATGQGYGGQGGPSRSSWSQDARSGGGGILGGIASALGFGSDRDDRGYEGYGSRDQGGQRQRGLGPRSYTRSDARIEEDVNEQLSRGYFDASDVEVKVKDGEVTLSGTVRSRQDKRRAEDLADDASGVRHVQNNLRVQDNWTSGGATPGLGGPSSSGQPQLGQATAGSVTNVTAGQAGNDKGTQAGSQSGLHPDASASRAELGKL